MDDKTLQKKMYQYTMRYINQTLECKCIEENPWPGIDCVAYEPDTKTTVFFEICYHNDEDLFKPRKDREAAMLEYVLEVDKNAYYNPIGRMRWDRITWQPMPQLGDNKALLKYACNI